MHNISIAGTGLWHPKDIITNDELVESYNTYVADFNIANKTQIENGELEEMQLSSSEFIEKASGIKTRYVIDKAGILDTNRMMPYVRNEDKDSLSLHAEIGLIASKKAMDQAGISVGDIDAIIVGTSHAPRNYPAIAIEI